jgi:hypothetical protein
VHLVVPNTKRLSHDLGEQSKTAMTQHGQQAEDQQLGTSDSKQSHHSSPAGPTRPHTPMQRWESEKDEDQPWNAVAASKHISDGKVCVGSGKTPSTVGQKGSVNEETK